MSLRLTLLVALGLGSLTIGAHATTFDLSGSIGATPSFGITSNGITATFTSPDGNGFAVQNTAGLLSFSPALLDNNFFGSDDLTISFSAPVSGPLTIPFAIQDAFGLGTDTLSVTTSAGQSLTFGTASNGLPLSEPEGVVSFAATGITSLTLSSDIAFAIGNVSVPEPVSFSLLGAGVVGLVASRRRLNGAGFKAATRS